MKALVTDQEALRAADQKSVYWFAKVYWPSPVGTKYYATRNFTADGGVTIDPVMESFPDVSRTMAIGVDEAVAVGTASFTLRNAPADASRVQIDVEQVSPQGVRVDLYMVFNEASLEEADWTLMGIYAVDEVEVGTRSVTFRCVDWVEGVGAKAVGYPVRADVYPDADAEAFGAIIPEIFGAVTDVPLLPVIIGRTTALDGSIDETETVLYVDGPLAGWPSSGTIKVGAEEIVYTAIDTVEMTFGTLASPCVRAANGTTAVEHSDRYTVRYVSSHIFAVADHECHGVTNV
ncbi:MAG: hypothetical protein KKH61_19805, partial [Gammaproteobacteria bacterium]|nr:hypothetical protein [Gammaproteobacteria bacterium]